MILQTDSSILSRYLHKIWTDLFFGSFSLQYESQLVKRRRFFTSWLRSLNKIIQNKFNILQSFNCGNGASTPNVLVQFLKLYVIQEIKNGFYNIQTLAINYLFAVFTISHEHKSRVTLAFVGSRNRNAVVGTQLIWSVIFAN